MTAFRRPLQALAGLLLVAVSILGAAAPSVAAPPPFPLGAQATALVGGSPLVKAVCPAGSPGQVKGGISTVGGVSVGYPAGARCSDASASSDGLYAISGATPPLPGTLRFSSSCANISGQTGGAVDVPTGTNVTGIGVVTKQTTVTTPNTVVTYPGGTTAILNEIVVDQFSITRNAIRITSGPNNGRIVGQVICGVVYPLAVDQPSGADDAALSSPVDTADSDRSTTVLLAGAAIGALLISQLAIGRRIRRQQRAAGA